MSKSCEMHFVPDCPLCKESPVGIPAADVRYVLPMVPVVPKEVEPPDEMVTLAQGYARAKRAVEVLSADIEGLQQIVTQKQVELLAALATMKEAKKALNEATQ